MYIHRSMALFYILLDKKVEFSMFLFPYLFELIFYPFNAVSILNARECDKNVTAFSDF